MIKIKIIVVDKTRAPFLREGESFYRDRLQRYARVEWVEVKPVRIKKGRTEASILIQEGQEIQKKVSERDHLVALDRLGREKDSKAMAKWLEKLAVGGTGQVCFAIGGPLGLSKPILEKASTVLSLSRLTLTHEMSRILLLEQIYRAFTILRGEKYHK